MQRRKLGELEVFAVGLGCATMTPFYDEPDSEAAIDTVRRAREIGVDFLDSSDAYAQGRNERAVQGTDCRWRGAGAGWSGGVSRRRRATHIERGV